MAQLEVNLFDFAAKRADVLERQQRAVERFQEELRELAVMEKYVRQMHEAQTNEIADDSYIIKDPDLAVTKYLTLEDKPNGKPKNGVYSGLFQSQAILQVLATAQSPLDYEEITHRLMEGGYPFTSKRPKGSVATTVRDLARRKKIICIEPDNRMAGARNRYMPNDSAAVEQPKRKKPVVTLTATVEAILQSAPNEGFSRERIVELLRAAKFPFGPGSHPHQQRVVWTLNSLCKQKRAVKHVGPSRHDDRFTLAQPSA
jgi:hypothetical protein